MQWCWRYIWNNSNLLRTLWHLLFWSNKILIYFINHLCFAYAWFITSLLKVCRRLKYSGFLLDYMWKCVCCNVCTSEGNVCWKSLTCSNSHKITKDITSSFEAILNDTTRDIYIYIYHILEEVTRVRLGMFNYFIWVSYIGTQLRILQSIPVSYRKTAFTCV